MQHLHTHTLIYVTLPPGRAGNSIKAKLSKCPVHVYACYFIFWQPGDMPHIHSPFCLITPCILGIISEDQVWWGGNLLHERLLCFERTLFIPPFSANLRDCSKKRQHELHNNGDSKKQKQNATNWGQNTSKIHQIKVKSLKKKRGGGLSFWKLQCTSYIIEKKLKNSGFYIHWLLHNIYFFSTHIYILMKNTTSIWSLYSEKNIEKLFPK